MRVLIFSPQFEKGAFELLQKELACSLNKFGVSVYTLNTHKSLLRKKSLKSNLIKKGVTKVFFIDLALNPNFIQLDVYSCKDFDQTIITKELNKFNPLSLGCKFLDRATENTRGWRMFDEGMA